MTESQQLMIETVARIHRDLCTKAVIDSVEEGGVATELWETMEQLNALGCNSILVMPIEKMMG